MNPEDRAPKNPAQDTDAGEPIEILKELELDTSAQFVGRVRGKIHRRTATSQVVTYSWSLPKLSLIELARLLTHLLQTFGANKESKQ
jgi:hypothetical protein